MEQRWAVETGREGMRLDRYLSEATGLTRARIQKAITAGGVLLNGAPAKASRPLSVGDEILFTPPAPVRIEARPEDIPLAVVYEDGDLIVVDKPRGMVVHPAAGNYQGTLVNALLAHCSDLSGIGGAIRPGIVHRLDKDTTGLLVAAKNDRTHLALTAQLKTRRMSRAYLALAHGRMPASSGRLEMPIGRHPVDRKRMAVNQRGRFAATNYWVIESLADYDLLGLVLESGRTHQIRVHLAAVGHPVVGDRTYGRRNSAALGLAGQALHAFCLAFAHPGTGEKMRFFADPPPDFLAALAVARTAAGIEPTRRIDRSWLPESDR